MSTADDEVVQRYGDVEFVSNADSGVAQLVLTAPPLNLFTNSLLEGLEACVRRVEDDKSIRALVICGGSGRHFSAGSDVKEMAELSRQSGAVEKRLRSENAAFDRVARLKLPTVAAIEGVALGSGLELALACDFRVAGGDARLGLPEVRIGVLSASGGLVRATKTLGLQRARRLVLIGRPMSAREALGIDLVDYVVPAGGARSRARALAGDLGSIPSRAFAESKIAMSCVARESDGDAREFVSLLALSLSTSQDAAEGAAAFIEKRVPVFSRLRS